MTTDGERRFIIDQNRQLNLTTMSWYKEDNLGENKLIVIDKSR